MKKITQSFSFSLSKHEMGLVVDRVVNWHIKQPKFMDCYQFGYVFIDKKWSKNEHSSDFEYVALPYFINNYPLPRWIHISWYPLIMINKNGSKDMHLIKYTSILESGNYRV